MTRMRDDVFVGPQVGAIVHQRRGSNQAEAGVACTFDLIIPTSHITEPPCSRKPVVESQQ